MKTIRIMTFNVQFGRRIARILHWLSHIPQPDILCFQEFPQDEVENIVQVYSNGEYDWRFARSLVRKKRIFGELTLFRVQDFRCKRTTVLEFGVSGFERKVFKNTLPRSCLLTILQHDKKSIIVGNAHLVAFALNKFKYRQAEIVTRALEKRRHPIIIVGDFNLSSVLGKRKLIQLMEQYGYRTEKKRLPTHRVAIIRHQFDYIFGKGCVVEDLSVERVRFSDHYPVFATVII